MGPGSRKSKLFSVKAKVASIHWLYNQKLEHIELNPVVDNIPKVRYTMRLMSTICIILTPPTDDLQNFN